MSSRLLSANAVSQGRAAQAQKLQEFAQVRQQRDSFQQNEQRLANLREAPRNELYRVNRDQINRIGPPPPKINNPPVQENGINKPRGVMQIGYFVDFWA